MGTVIIYFCLIQTLFFTSSRADDILGCGGFIKSHVPLDYSKIEIGLYTKGGILQEITECAPTNGYYFLPLYEKGEYTLKVHPPPGWSFEPSEKVLLVDGVTDLCSMGQDINFSFNGFGIAGQVITAGQKEGPSGVSVQLIADQGEVRNTVTTSGGSFSFTPVIPGKYTVKASHPKWQLNPAQAVVQVKEGNTALPPGVLAVKGYDVKGSITAFGQPISGVYVLLYSKQVRQTLRVEGCSTALLQGVKDSPICHVITNSLGEFTFGVVPAGEYELAVLATTPGQVAQTYNVRPSAVQVEFKHDSLYIKDAFEITGFNLVGTTSAGEGFLIPESQILLDNVPVAKVDQSGKFTLTALQPGTYTVTAKHESCEFAPAQLKVTPQGVLNPVNLKVSAWLVCGSVTPPPQQPRVITITSVKGAVKTVDIKQDGDWCTFLARGEYTAQVEVTEQDKRDGLQYFPVTQKIYVIKNALEQVKFSQLKATVKGSVTCVIPRDCEGLTVTLKMGDSGNGGTMTTTVQDGTYTFESVLPGVVHVSVDPSRFCWKSHKLVDMLQTQLMELPPFQQTAYALTVSSNYDVPATYKSPTYSGSMSIVAGSHRHCLPSAEQYTVTPGGCHRFQPREYVVDMTTASPSIELNAVAHSNVIKLVSPMMVPDLTFSVQVGDKTKVVEPMKGKTTSSGDVEYEYNLYLADGESALVWASSSQLVVEAGRHRVVGGPRCSAPGAPALELRARRGVRVTGSVVPPVEGVTITLTGNDELTLTQTTGPDGKYQFGPLDASKQYTVTAEKESYVFGERDENGNIPANKLGEIHIKLVDVSDNAPLQGAVVSVSGGSYRRTQASGADGRLVFASLPPGQYYVKPLLAEYRFLPPHATVPLRAEGQHHVTLNGTRVAWSCSGRVVSAGGAGWRGAALRAAGAGGGCPDLHARADHQGAFRIRGLLPECTYSLQLKPTDDPELQGLNIVKAPALVQVKDKKDLTDVTIIAMQNQQMTDSSILVFSPNIELYKTLRLTLALEDTPTTYIYTTKLDSTGFTFSRNPGLMYTLPRLPADNKSYILKLESTLSKSTHSYEEQAFEFTADGGYKSFHFEFTPKTKSSEQELKHTPIGVVPLIVAGALAYWQRDRITASLSH